MGLSGPDTNENYVKLAPGQIHVFDAYQVNIGRGLPIEHEAVVEFEGGLESGITVEITDVAAGGINVRVLKLSTGPFGGIVTDSVQYLRSKPKDWVSFVLGSSVDPNRNVNHFDAGSLYIRVKKVDGIFAALKVTKDRSQSGKSQIKVEYVN